MAVAMQEEYIYCIRLPFQCTSQGPSNLDSLLLGQPPRPSSESFVAKVGITENPAQRLRKIYTAFQEFGEPQPILDILSSSMKAKSIDDIIFIEKVRNPGKAEHNIREMIVKESVIQFGQPELNQEFRESFKAKVPETKKHYLESGGVGITEWIIISCPLAVNLQQKFRQGGVCPGYVPSGEQLTRLLTEYCRTQIPFQSPSQDRLILATSNKRLPLLFEFRALNFSCQLDCMPLRIQRPDAEI